MVSVVVSPTGVLLIAVFVSLLALILLFEVIGVIYRREVRKARALLQDEHQDSHD